MLRCSPLGLTAAELASSPLGRSDKDFYLAWKLPAELPQTRADRSWSRFLQQLHVGLLLAVAA